LNPEKEDKFQIETRSIRGKLSAGTIGWDDLDWSSEPDLYKTYPESKKFLLPKIKLMEKFSLHQCLMKRRSIRRFSQEFIDQNQLGYLLWSSTGIQRKEGEYHFRTAPSAGALYPIETYILVNRIENLPSGIYHYSIYGHLLEELKKGDYSEQLASAALGQKMCSEAAVIFIWSAFFARSKWKYKQRAYRYIYLDAGHIAQNLALSATSMGLGSCQIGAFYDEEVNQLIDLNSLEESVIYMSSVGYPLTSLV
jgi:SagB-type dehydrogenase family enzyme